VWKNNDEISQRDSNGSWEGTRNERWECQKNAERTKGKKSIKRVKGDFLTWKGSTCRKKLERLLPMWGEKAKVKQSPGG